MADTTQKTHERIHHPRELSPLPPSFLLLKDRSISFKRKEDSYDRVIGVINEVDEVTVLGQRTRAANLPEGVSGFFGLGVNQVS
jgi:hypothetical protein